MDHFGIGAALLGAARIYFQSARGTGRTVSMIESLKNGDRIIFSNAREAKRVEKLFKEDGKEIDCVVYPPDMLKSILELGTGQGRTIFDHSWIEERYLFILKGAAADIDYFQTELSGYGEPHRETKRRAMELSKWRV